MQRNPSGRAVAVLSHVDVRERRVFAVFLVRAFAVEHDDAVGVLFVRAGFAEDGEDRDRWVALLDVAGELRQGDHRAAEFSRELLQGSRDVADLLRAVFAVPVGDFDELQVIDDVQVEAVFNLLAAGFGAQAGERRVGIVVVIGSGGSGSSEGHDDAPRELLGDALSTTGIQMNLEP